MSNAILAPWLPDPSEMIATVTDADTILKHGRIYDWHETYQAEPYIWFDGDHEHAAWGPVTHRVWFIDDAWPTDVTPKHTLWLTTNEYAFAPTD